MLKQRAVGTFSSYDKTETALKELRDSGFAMDAVSVVGRDMDRHSEVAGANTTHRLADLHDDDNEAAETAKKGAVAGTTVGGLTGLLVGLGALAIPGVGPVMLAGAAATAIATAVSGGAIGAAAGSLAGALVGMNIPEDRARNYGQQVEDGDYLVMVEGSVSQIAAAEAIFNKYGIHDWFAYDIPDNSANAATPVTTNYLEH